jgi:tetratricopeptide (TPR) repeat protein
MAKKKKRRSEKSSVPNKQLTLAELEDQFAENVAAGNFRRAAGIARRLCDHDLKRYEPLLFQALISLVDVLLDKGKISPARTAFDRLNKMSSAPEVDDLALRLARESGDFIGTSTAAVRLLTAEPRGADDDDHHQYLQKLRAADVLVLSFAAFPLPLAAEYPGPAAELSQVHQALELICKKSYNEALDAVATLGRRSLFSHWRLYIKGLVAFYRGEDDKAKQAFSRLPEGSWLVGAAAPFLLLLLPAEDPSCQQLAKDESRLRAACILADRSELADILPRANYLWMTGRHRDSFRYLHRSRINFPAETPDVCGSLTRFYYNAGYHLEGKQREQYIFFLCEAVAKEMERNKTIVLQGIRLAALYSENDEDEEDEMVLFWQDFIRYYQFFYGENKRIVSLVYAHLGELFARKVAGMEMSPFHLPGYLDAGRDESEIFDPEEAEKYFLLSIETDDGNKNSWLALLDLYSSAGWKTKENRLLDDIVKHFPDDKDALFKAGTGCWERHAWHKGRKYFRRALDLDPLDSYLQEKFILTTVSLALEQVLKGRLERCCSLLDEIVEITRPKLDDLNCGRSYLLGRWVIFYLLAYDEDKAQEYYAQAMETAPNPDKLLYFIWMYALCRGVDRNFLTWMEKPLKKLFSRASVPTAMGFLEVFRYCCRMIDEDFSPLKKEEMRLHKLLVKAMRQADVGQVVEVIEYAFDDPVTGKPVIRACLRRLKAIDSRSPYYLFYDYVANHLGAGKLPRNRDVTYLREILLLAEKTQDRQLIGRIKTQLTKLESFMDMLEGMQNHIFDELVAEDDLDDDDDGWDMSLPPGASQVPDSWKRKQRPGSEKKDQLPQDANELSETSSLFDTLND